MGTTWARPASEVSYGDEDGDAEDPAPAEGASLASDPTPIPSVTTFELMASRQLKQLTWGFLLRVSIPISDLA